MRRRDLLGAAGGAVLLSRMSWARDVPGDIKITRVVSFELESTRPKYVGKNSFRHDHGTKAYDRILRLYTNAGIDGFGTCWSGANECAPLLGKSPLDFFDCDARKVEGPLGRFTSAIWDLAGKVLGKPVWQLLGGGGPARVPVYDGSIYFIDLRPEHRGDWQDAFKRELDLGLSLGHRGFKVKIGRGRLWMLTDQGYERDVEVVRLVRRHVGPDVLIGVDANDAYDFERTKRFVADTADCRLAFVEEMFQESVEDYLKLKAFVRERGLKILIADGENRRRPEEMKSWVEAKAVDILQGDMNQFGFEDVLAEAAMARPYGVMVAPHNWGSLIGYYMQLHVGRAITNFYRAEQDPMNCPAVIAEGFKIEDGQSTVPDAPGLGLKLDDGKLADVACVHFDLKA